VAGDGRSLEIGVANEGRSEVVLEHRWVPDVFPAVVAGSLPEGSSRAFFEGSGLDGENVSMEKAATLAWLPRTGRNATLTNLDTAARTGTQLGAGAELELWFARDDGQLLARATGALGAAHMSVLHVSRTSQARTVLAQSAASWSLQLGVLVGVASLLVAALGLVIAAAASWRPRTRDLAILTLNGVPPGRTARIALGEQLPAIVVAVLAGAAVGALAAHWAMPTIPLLPSEPPVDLLDLSFAWPPVLLVAAGTVVALCVVGWLLSSLVARRSDLTRVQEPAGAAGPRSAPVGWCTSTAPRVTTWRRCRAST
jgi:hypothetical protein